MLRRVSTLISQKIAKLTIRNWITALRKTPMYVQGHGTGLLRVREGRRRRALQGNKDVGEVDAADGQADDRGEDVLDQAVHHRGEGDADNDADGEVDHVAAHDEGTKLVDPTRSMH